MGTIDQEYSIYVGDSVKTTKGIFIGGIEVLSAGEFCVVSVMDFNTDSFTIKSLKTKAFYPASSKDLEIDLNNTSHHLSGGPRYFAKKGDLVVANPSDPSYRSFYGVVGKVIELGYLCETSEDYALIDFDFKESIVRGRMPMNEIVPAPKSMTKKNIPARTRRKGHD